MLLPLYIFLIANISGPLTLAAIPHHAWEEFGVRLVDRPSHLKELRTVTPSTVLEFDHTVPELQISLIMLGHSVVS